MTDVLSAPYVALPAQPADVPWPTDTWPGGSAPDGVDLEPLIEEMHTDTAKYGTTFATVVIHRGRLIHERYGGVIEHWDRADEPVSAVDARFFLGRWPSRCCTPLVGILLDDGALLLDVPAAIPAWQQAGDGRRAR